ncbi:Gag-Pol polyprotein [Elysia marginata]|uniref:Gag-Pol polyprotein n=1 Tax=Elysia marginata TaxID=1093978 RepID=A0AAV4GDH7_9GAST|nr:Gag-Pol polyprotein [Elysia marginata]
MNSETSPPVTSQKSIPERNGYMHTQMVQQKNATKNGGSGVYTHARWSNYRKISTHRFALHELQSRTGSNQGGVKADERDNCRPVRSQSSDSMHSYSKSALQKLEDPKAAEQEYLRDALQNLEKQTETLILQWIPGHCKIDGNEKADRLARERSDPQQLSDGLSYHKAKQIIKSLMKEKWKYWKTRNPYQNRQDDLHQMDRKGQTTIFRLRTGHNKVKAHLYKKTRLAALTSARVEKLVKQ